MKRVVVLGASGSIGKNTSDVIERNPEHFRLVGVSGFANAEAIAELCRTHDPDVAVMVDGDAAKRLAQLLSKEGLRTEVMAGVSALDALASDSGVDYVMAAIVGSAGLSSSLAAAKAGKRVLLANKESLVMAGPLFMGQVARGGGELIPIDSEHNALFQSMPTGYRAGAKPSGVARLWLTCSGGPFLYREPEGLLDVTPDQACAHPRWSMGRKISVDSATLMNKGLEVIEASYLFGMPLRDVQVVIHPQSMIHSLVEYVDGSFVSQLGLPDMRTPIACGLAWPDRVSAGVKPLDLTKLGTLDFQAPDEKKFPCLRLAKDSLQAGGTTPAALNAANEVAVAAFLGGNLDFLKIPDVIGATLETVECPPATDLDTILAVDQSARATATSLIKSSVANT